MGSHTLLLLWIILIGLRPGTAKAQPFTKIDTGVMVSDKGDSRSVNFIDYDRDGDLDLFVSNGLKAGFNNFFYRNDGAGRFTKITEGPHVTDQAPSVGTTWGDYDNDGDPDLFVTNWYGLANQLYTNSGDGTFTAMTQASSVSDAGYSEAASWGDYDHDGDLDLFIAKVGDQDNVLYRNDTATGRHWLLLNLIGTTSNTSALGAVVRVLASINGKPVWQTREVTAQSGYTGQNLRLHFGLGDAAAIDSLHLIWPSGLQQATGPLSADRVLTITEGMAVTGETGEATLPDNR